MLANPVTAESKLVTQANFKEAVAYIAASPSLTALDVETTGRFWWKTPHANWYVPRIFALQITTECGREFYFDFEHSHDKLLQSHFLFLQRDLFDDLERYWFIHNAKFEMHWLANHGCEIKGEIHCTQSIARVVNNVEEEVGLEALAAKHLGEFKILPNQDGVLVETWVPDQDLQKFNVKDYIAEHKLYTTVDVYGKEEQFLHFDKVPLELMMPYALQDTKVGMALGKWQLKQVQLADATYYKGAKCKMSDVVAMENRLNKTSFRMERHGIKIDRAYCEEALAHEKEKYGAAEKELAVYVTPEILALIKEKHNEDSINWGSAHHTKTFFEHHGATSYKLTKKGKMSFDKEALETITHPSAKLILTWRYHTKRANTYFANFLLLADVNDVIHPSIQNGGAETGRQSIWSPSMQNVPKRGDKDEEYFKVRRCFIPPKGTYFSDYDFSGAEFYMAMNYAREMVIIELIKMGLDPHMWTVEQFSKLGITLKNRDTAKTMTFRIIYGAGGETIGVAIGYERGSWHAKKFGKAAKEAYFRMLPKFKAFMENVQDAAKQRGYVFTWNGFLLRYVNTGGFGKETWFKSPNGVIQGGIGATLKVAMNRIDEKFSELGVQSRMILPVHDAILFVMVPGEEYLHPIIDELMRTAYPAKVLPLKVEAAHSATCWSSLTDEIPTVA